MSNTSAADPLEPVLLTAATPRLGHRKISAALGTFAAGQVFGVDLMIWLWDLLALWVSTPAFTLPIMPEAVAQNLVTLVSFLVFYRTKEDVT